MPQQPLLSPRLGLVAAVIPLLACAASAPSTLPAQRLAAGNDISCDGLAAHGRPVRALDATLLDQLVGEYRLQVVATTHGYPDPQRSGVVYVTRTPEQALWYAPALNPARRRAQPLTAAIHWNDGGAEVPVPSTLRLRDRTFVAVAEGGCFDCWNRSYRITWIGLDSFGGTWYGDFGSVALVGADGERIDRVEGEYCARRVREDRSSVGDT